MTHKKINHPLKRLVSAHKTALIAAAMGLAVVTAASTFAYATPNAINGADDYRKLDKQSYENPSSINAILGSAGYNYRDTDFQTRIRLQAEIRQTREDIEDWVNEYTTNGADKCLGGSDLGEMQSCLETYLASGPSQRYIDLRKLKMASKKELAKAKVAAARAEKQKDTKESGQSRPERDAKAATERLSRVQNNFVNQSVKLTTGERIAFSKLNVRLGSNLVKVPVKIDTGKRGKCQNGNQKVTNQNGSLTFSRCPVGSVKVTVPQKVQRGGKTYKLNGKTWKTISLRGGSVGNVEFTYTDQTQSLAPSPNKKATNSNKR